MRASLVALLLFVPTAPVLEAQTPAELVASGRALERDPSEALPWYERALREDSTFYEANWRSAVALVELGEAAADSNGRREPEDSLFVLAERRARRAASDSTRPEGLFALALALGRTAERGGNGDRVRLGDEIHALAVRILTLAPDHDGAHHVLGLWNAEVMRISGFRRLVARKVLGSKTMGEASWEAAVAHLERAVALDPGRIVHRLDLARVYADRKRWESARREIGAIAGLPDLHSGDPRYRRAAERLGDRIARRG
jgi:tetratricopeptide (TPR) repeat protein